MKIITINGITFRAKKIRHAIIAYKLLYDERLSPMTYKKLKELGYNHDNWKNWNQQQANDIIKKHSNKKSNEEKLNEEKIKHNEKISNQMNIYKNNMISRYHIDNEEKVKAIKYFKNVEAKSYNAINNYNFAKDIKSGKFDNSFMAEKIIENVINLEGTAQTAINRVEIPIENVKEFISRFKENEKNGKDYLYNITKQIANESMQKRVNYLEKTKAEFDDTLKKYLKQFTKFEKIAKIKGWEISKSPYSDSYYIFPKNEEIDWGHKPEGSYRLSNHWNFESRGDKHCRSDDIENDEIAIGVYKNGKYYKVK